MKVKTNLIAAITLSVLATNAQAAECPVTYDELHLALAHALDATNGGLDFDMWATAVDRDGVVCAVAKADGLDTGTSVDPWPGSRVISAQKANTANAFSNEQLSLSTANLFSAVQPGASLFGLQHSNPVDTSVAYAGTADGNNGLSSDPMVGHAIGGVNVFGGGLALYDAVSGDLLGAVGVSGDTSCADHNVAWKTRANLGFNFGPGGVTGTDNINYQPDPADEDAVALEGLAAAFSHPLCGFSEKLVNDALLAAGS